MADNYNAILDHEEKFAKNLGFQLRAGRPQPAWHLFVPLKFLFEFFAAKREVDQFTGEFLFIRRPALEAARAAADADRQAKPAAIETAVRDRLTPNTPYAGEMLRRQAALAQLLLDHYSLLLNSTGGNYASLVRHAYTSRAGYESFLRKLAAAENEIDRITLAIRGGSAELQAQTALKQKAAHTLRTREAQDIFKK